MRFGLDTAQHQLSWDALLERVRFAERLGFDGAWVFDHFKPLYADPNGPCLEGWTLMAGLAAATERIRLGTLVTGITYRHPSILAAEAVTVDHISHGRVELAVGAAWFEGEHRELGIPFPPARERADRLDEAVGVMRALMTEDHVTFEGRYYRLQDASYHPRPVQHPTPPIWIGAAGEKVMLPIAARQADVWHCSASGDALARKSALVDRFAREAGRDPAEIARAGDVSIEAPWDQVRERIRFAERLGFTYLVVGWPSGGAERVEEFIREIMPEFAG